MNMQEAGDKKSTAFAHKIATFRASYVKNCQVSLGIYLKALFAQGKSVAE